MRYNEDIRQGLAIAARVVGVAMILGIILSFTGVPHIVLPIGKNGLELLSKPSGHHCVFCGMTRGFCSLSRGNLSSAIGFNRYAPEVYVAFWLGGILTVFSLLRHRKNKV